MRGEVIDDLWLFIDHGPHHTWTRAEIPHGIRTARELVDHIRRGGQLVSPWMDLPKQARLTPRLIGMTVIAHLENGN